MSTFKTLMLIIVVSIAVSYFIYPDPEIKPADPKDLPWGVMMDEQGNTSLIGITFDQTPFKQSFEIFGQPESMALYADPKDPNIEVYFGTIKKAGLSAKIILSLHIPQALAEDFLKNAKKRMTSTSGIPKINLAPSDRIKTEDIKISALTYLPVFSGLEENYLFERFGTPEKQIKLSESASQYFYPSKGVSLVIDKKGKEVFQYSSPTKLIIPETAIDYAAQ